MSIFFKENAFRVLSVPANATRSEILEAYQTLRARARVGGLQSPQDPLLFLNSIERNELTLRDALNRIENPLTRIRERMFWLVNVSSNRTLWNDFIGRCKSDAGKKGDLVTDIPSRINLAILNHARCIATDPDARDQSIWQAALSEWDILITDDSFWDWCEAVEQKSGFEPSIDSSEIDCLRSEAWYLILGYTRQQIYLALNTKNYDDLKRHQNLTYYITSQSSVARKLLSEILNPIEDLLEERQKQILNNLNTILNNEKLPKAEKEKACNQSYEAYKSDLVPLVKEIRKIAGVTADESKRASEKTASCLRDIAVSGYHNTLEAYDISEMLLKDAQVMAFDTLYADRLNEDLKVVSGNRLYSNLKPLKDTPLLGTSYGIGSKLYGKSDYDATTQSYLTTLYFVLFYIPLFPKARYRVIDVGNNSYRFLGKANFRSIEKIHTACFALSICLMVYWMYWESTHATLYIDNGTGNSITIAFQNWDTIASPPGLKIVRIPVGGYHVQYLNYQSNLDIRNGVWIFNPGRVNYYKRYRVYYGSPTHSSTSNSYLGNPELLEANADYIFQSPPSSISTKNSSESRVVLERTDPYENDNTTSRVDENTYTNNSSVPSATKDGSIPVIKTAALYRGKEVRGNIGQRVTSLSPWEQQFTCRIQVGNINRGTTVEMIWMKLMSNRLESILMSKKVTVSRDTPLDFTFTPADHPIQPGVYQLRILLDGMVARTLDFTVAQTNDLSDRGIPQSFVPNPPFALKDQLKAEIDGYRIRLDRMESELSEIGDGIKSYKEQIDIYENTIQRIERDNNLGFDVDREEYNKALSNHNYYVELHNTALSKYKSLYSEYEDLLQIANIAIKKYNGE